MHKNRIFIPLVVSILLLPLPAFAEAVSGSSQDGSAHASMERLAIVEDQQAAAFRFVIDGREVARLDVEGLHVRENIEYGGTATDTGTAYYEREAGASEGAP